MGLSYRGKSGRWKPQRPAGLVVGGLRARASVGKRLYVAEARLAAQPCELRLGEGEGEGGVPVRSHPCTDSDTQGP